MNKAQHKSNNHVFGAPAGCDQTQPPYSALPVTIGEYGGQPCIASFWRPTAEELSVLNGGGLVQLHIIGTGMPPVSIGVTEE